MTYRDIIVFNHASNSAAKRSCNGKLAILSKSVACPYSKCFLTAHNEYGGRSEPAHERKLLDVESIDPAVKRPAADAELVRGGGLVAADLGEHALDLIALRRREAARGGRP